MPDHDTYDIYDEVNAFKAQMDVSPPVNDTAMLKQLRDTRQTDEDRAKYLLGHGYPGRNPNAKNVTFLWNQPPGTLVRPTDGRPVFGRVHR